MVARPRLKTIADEIALKDFQKATTNKARLFHVKQIYENTAYYQSTLFHVNIILRQDFSVDYVSRETFLFIRTHENFRKNQKKFIHRLSTDSIFVKNPQILLIVYILIIYEFFLNCVNFQLSFPKVFHKRRFCHHQSVSRETFFAT